MIQKTTFEFLSNLKKNNSKEWFDKNRPFYEVAKKDFQTFISELIQATAKNDAAIKNLESKNCVFRINRDVRFSKDKSPYKSNMGAIISPGGKKSFTAGYYIHLQPGGSFLAGGMWMPPPPQLAAIRQEIDYHPTEINKIIKNKNFTKHFGKLAEDDKLKTVPKGYDKTHPEIELLKHRSFIVVHNFKDKEVLSKDFLKSVVEVYKTMLPLNLFLRKACD